MKREARSCRVFGGKAKELAVPAPPSNKRTRGLPTQLGSLAVPAPGWSGFGLEEQPRNVRRGILRLDPPALAAMAGPSVSVFMEWGSP